MKVAILCVYYYDEDSEWVYNLQVDQLKKNLGAIEFTIFACFVKGQSTYLIESFFNHQVKIFPSVSDSTNPSIQHSENLDNLLSNVSNDVYEFIVTMDMDAFPICPEWLDLAVSKMQSGNFCAVFREENGDTVLPHPCFTVFKSSFLQANKFVMYPERNILDSEPFKNFLARTGQRVDSGIGLAFEVDRSHIVWERLFRDNVNSTHYLMEGIYGGIVFHLGASSREPIFSRDVRDSRWIYFTSWMRKVPLIWRIYEDFIYPFIRSLIIRRNQKCLENAKRRLLSDPESYFLDLINKV